MRRKLQRMQFQTVSLALLRVATTPIYVYHHIIQLCPNCKIVVKEITMILHTHNQCECIACIYNI